MILPDDGLFFLFASCVLIAAAILDLRYQRIPNALTFPTILIALAYAGFTRGVDGLLFSTGGMVLGMATLIVPYLMGGMGAGDVKLLGAVGAILGPLGVVNAFVLTALVGVIYAVLVVLFNYKGARGVAARLTTILKTLVRTGQFIYIPAPKGEEQPKLCYGIAISLGALCTIAWKLLHHSFLISSFT